MTPTDALRREQVAATGRSVARRRHITITLSGPWKGKDADFLLRKWGLPPGLDWDALDALAHHRAGGWNYLRLPPAHTIAAYVRKARSHPDAVAALLGLAKCAIFSQLDLADAMHLMRTLLRQCPHLDQAVLVHEWRALGVSAVNVLQARWPGGAGMRDPQAAAQEFFALRDDLNEIEMDIADAQYAALRSRFRP